MAKLLIVLAFCVSAICAAPPKQSIGTKWRVVGGADANECQFPFIVYFITSSGYQYCDGSIINENWILTGAHCVDSVSPNDGIKIIAGSTELGSGVSYLIERVVVNEGWNWADSQHDIGLAKLASPIIFNDKIQPIPLETENVGAGVDSILCGYGDVNLDGPAPGKLQFLNVKTVSNEQCAAAHDMYPIGEKQICTLTKYGEGACYGDGGGPLISNGKQIGILSWLKPCAVGLPDVFTRVSSYTSWINESIRS